MDGIEIAVCLDDLVTRIGFGSLLRDYYGSQAHVTEFDSLPELAQALSDKNFRLALLRIDVQTDLGDLRRVSDCGCGIILIDPPHQISIRALVTNGVRGFVFSPTRAEVVHRAIAAIAGGDLYIGPNNGRHQFGEPALRAHDYGISEAVVGQLTPREKQIAQEILAGRSNREIAQTLYVSISTVKSHLRTIMKKTATADRIELAARLVCLESAATP